MVEKQEDQAGRKKTEAPEAMSLEAAQSRGLPFLTLIKLPNNPLARRS